MGTRNVTKRMQIARRVSSRCIRHWHQRENFDEKGQCCLRGVGGYLYSLLSTCTSETLLDGGQKERTSCLSSGKCGVTLKISFRVGETLQGPSLSAAAKLQSVRASVIIAPNQLIYKAFLCAIFLFFFLTLSFPPFSFHIHNNNGCRQNPRQEPCR